MRNNDPATITTEGSYLIYPAFAPFPFAFFLGAFVTDLVYWRAPDAMWETFSVWLISAGLVVAAFSVIAGVIDLVSRRRRIVMRSIWPHVPAIATAFLLALINAFVHSRDGYTAVVPTGLLLSGLVVIILLFAAWMRRRAVHDHSAEGIN
jgi:uncharacterized membrane protein